MITLTQAELLTLSLYIGTVALLLITLVARHDRAQRVSAAISLVFGALASVGLYGCLTGQANDWPEVPAHSVSKAPSAKRDGGMGGGDGGGGVAATGTPRGAAASGDSTADAGGYSDQSAGNPIGAASSPLGVVRASFALGPQPNPTGKPFRDCSDCPEMVAVPRGFAPLGSDGSDESADASETPQRIVRIAKPFAIGRFEVTVSEFGAFLTAVGRTPRPCDAAEATQPRLPAQCISWSDARAYAAWLSELTGKSYRLPSSSEWEYAARARTGTPYASGVRLSPADANIGFSATAVTPVGAFPLNGFGLADMTGNVAEMVVDCWLPTLHAAPADGTAAFRGADCSRRTLRDAAWFEGSTLARSAARRPIALDTATAGIGFRVARELR